LTGPRPGASTDLHMLGWWRLERIQCWLGHTSVQTTERYPGCTQNLGHTVNDRFTPGTRIASPASESLNQVILLSVKTTSEVCEVEPVQQKCSEWGPERGDAAPNGWTGMYSTIGTPKWSSTERQLLTRPAIEVCGRNWMRRFT
jgi:hypothetical protein